MSILPDGWAALHMRRGRHLGRTLYLADPAQPDRDQDQVVGLVDTEALAIEICRRWNAKLD